MKNFFAVVSSDKVNKIRYSLPIRLFRFSPQFKIFNPIVRSYSVFMVDVFKWIKFSAEMLFHNIPMFQNIFSSSINQNFPITIRYDNSILKTKGFFSPVAFNLAFWITKKFFTSFKTPFICIKNLLAVKAFDVFSCSGEFSKAFFGTKSVFISIHHFLKCPDILFTQKAWNKLIGFIFSISFPSIFAPAFRRTKRLKEANITKEESPTMHTLSSPDNMRFTMFKYLLQFHRRIIILKPFIFEECLDA